MSSKIAKAILRLKPDAQFVIRNEIIEWHTDNILTAEEINASLLVLEAEEYKNKRQAEYPSFADQFDTIFHQGLDAWKAQIQAVKDKYPKAGE